MKKKKFLALPVLLLFITALIVSKNQELPQILLALDQVQFPYLVLACLLMGINWLINSSILKILFRTNPVPLTWKNAIQLTMVGQYYSAITPFSSGGQPAQVLSMNAKHIPVGRATSLLMVKFLLYQITVVFYAFGFFAWKYRYLQTTLSGSLPWVALGLVLNGLLILLILLSLLQGKWLEKKLIRLIEILGSKRKNLQFENWKSRIHQTLNDYEASAKEVQAEPAITVKILLLTILQLTAYFGVSWAIYRSFGLAHIGIIRILALQSLLYMAVSFIPTPGNAGASEGGFLLVFHLLYSGATLMPAMLIWRLITYYFNLLFGGLITFYDHWECAQWEKEKASS